MPDDPGRPSEVASRMLQLLNAFLAVQALHVAAALRIPDLLADGPATADRRSDPRDVCQIWFGVLSK